MTDAQFRAWLKIRVNAFQARIEHTGRNGKPDWSPASLAENLKAIAREAERRASGKNV